MYPYDTRRLRKLVLSGRPQEEVSKHNETNDHEGASDRGDVAAYKSIQGPFQVRLAGEAVKQGGYKGGEYEPDGDAGVKEQLLVHGQILLW